MKKHKKPNPKKSSRTTKKAKTNSRNQANNECIVRRNKLQSNKQQIPPQPKVGIQIQLRDHNALIGKVEEWIDDHKEVQLDASDNFDTTTITDMLSSIALAVSDCVPAWLSQLANYLFSN